MKWSLLLLLSQVVICSELEGDDEESREFIGLDRRIDSDDEYSTGRSKTVSTATATSGRNYFDEILMDEVVSISLNCEKSLGSTEESLKSFVMKSLDFTAEETLSDLERPACRAFFDRNGHHLSKEQVVELMSTERGKGILLDGEVLEFFSDFSDFILKDFDKFPALRVSKIRDLSSISAEVLLALVRRGGFTNAGRLERIPEHFGDRVLEHESWKLDPEIWQLFTLEGIAQIHSVANVEKFAKFLADRSKFEKLIFFLEDNQDDMVDLERGNVEEDDSLGSHSSRVSPISFLGPVDATTLRNRLRSSTISSDTSIRLTAAPTSTICKTIAKNAPLLARWAVQSEELTLYMMEMYEVGRSGENYLNIIQEAVNGLIGTRIWLKEQIRESCVGAIGISENEALHLGSLKVLLNSPLAWRLKEALRLFITTHSVNLNSASQMTQTLMNRLNHFPKVVGYYRSMFSGNGIEPNDHLLTHFFLVNEIVDLESIFGDEVSTEDIPIPEANEKLVLSIAIRRILLLLLSPTLDASNVIQDALNYVFTAQSPLLATSDSNEILRWFRQAQDLQAIPVLDRLIRNFGHEFDVSREIKSVLSNRSVRMKLFTEAQSNLVRLLVCLSNGLSEHLIDDAPRILVLPYLDPANALLKGAVPPLLAHPKRPHTQEEIDAHALLIVQAREHNVAINPLLETSLLFLKTFSVSPNDQLSANFAGFVQPNFRVQFSDNVGIDAGGLRRTWLSALLRIFGDSQRMLFPQHDEGGRTPAALLDPEIMGHLGALHGKSLQVGVKPDWFFTARYTHNLLFAQTAPVIDDLLQLTENLFPAIFSTIDLIAQLESSESEAAAVEYFNSSEFPAISGLSVAESEIEIDADANVNVETDVNADVNTEMVADTVSVNSTITAEDSDSEGSVGSLLQDVTEEFAVVDIPASSSPTTTTVSFAPRHSFSRLLVFDVRYLAQESIYSGPRATAQSLDDIQTYRADLQSLLAQNLLAGRQAYLRSFYLFFDEQYRPILDAAFLHILLEPPVVTIEEILARTHFHRNCDEIFLIDDDQIFDDSESYEAEEKTKDDIVDDREGEGSINFKRKSSAFTSSASASNNKKSRSPLPRRTNISARTALTRILSTSFASQETIRSLLSFSTGCPQIPPAGLDALRISVHCYSNGSKMSKSHTCSNTIDFHVSMGYLVTKDAFIESAISSSGFGFD